MSFKKVKNEQPVHAVAPLYHKKGNFLCMFDNQGNTVFPPVGSVVRSSDGKLYKSAPNGSLRRVYV